MIWPISKNWGNRLRRARNSLTIFVHYPDLQFLLRLLVTGEHTQEASEILRSITHPLEVSLVHRLHIENGLLRSLRDSDASRQSLAREALLLWRQYLLEEMFHIVPFDLETAFAQAAQWNGASDHQPPKWSLLIHPALAASKGAAFMSFTPGFRQLAREAGLSLLPEML